MQLTTSHQLPGVTTLNQQ